MDKANHYIDASGWIQSGLIYLPPQRRSRQISVILPEVVGKNLCLSDISGEALPLNKVIELIREIPQLVLVRYVSTLSAALDRESFSNRNVQLELTKMLAVGQYRTKIIEMVEKDNHVLFAPRTLTALLKMAIVFGKEELTDDPSLTEKIITAQLALTDHLDRDFELQVNRIGTENAEMQQAILRFAIQNGDIHVHYDPVELSCRLWAVLHLWPEQYANEGILPTPNEIFSRKTGLDLAKFMALVYAPTVWSALIDFKDHRSIDDHLILSQNVFAGTAIDPTTAMSHFEKFVLPASEINKLRKKSPLESNYFFDYSMFAQYPLYELASGVYLPMFYPYFRWRVTEGLYWDIYSYASQDSPNQERFMQNFGHYYQSYIQSRFEKVFPSSGPFQRMWPEPKKSSSDPAPDIITQYPEGFLFVEIKAARLKYYESVLKGRWDDIEDDCRKMLFEPAEQLDKAIRFFCQGNLSLNGRKWKGERIYPVIVLYGMPQVFQQPWFDVKEELRKRGLLQQQFVHDLVILNPYETVSLLNLASKGFSCVEMLKEKSRPPYDQVHFHNYAISRYGEEATPRQIIDDLWDEFTAFVQKTIIPPK